MNYFISSSFTPDIRVRTVIFLSFPIYFIG